MLRSDLRVGDCNGGAGAFFFTDDDGLALADVAAMETARELCLLLFLDVPFVCVPFATTPRKPFLTGGSGGAVSRFTRDDFLTPLSKIVVGPSAANDLHGGDAARDNDRRGVRLSSFLRFAGRDAWMASSPSP